MPPKRRFEKVVPVWFTKNQIDFIKELADERGLTQSDIIRMMIDESINDTVTEEE